MKDIARLLPSDEGLNHQIPQTFGAVLHSDPTWTEKIWTTIVRRDGSLQVDFGLGKYLNLNVMDAFGGLSKGQSQWTVRASRELFSDAEDSAVGPLSYSVLEPLKCVRFTLAETNVVPLSFELTFEAWLPPFFEDRHLQRDASGSRAIADLVRYHQAGTVTGWIRLNRDRYSINKEEWFAFRDHSWGIRPGVGQPESGASTPGFDPRGRFYMAWSPMTLRQADGQIYEIQYFYMANGEEPFYSSGYVNYSDGRQERIVRTRPELRYDPKTRMLTGGCVRFEMESGKVRTVDMEPVGDCGFHLGLGLYFGLDGYTHGMRRGPLHVDGEYVAQCQEENTLRRIHQLRDRPIRVRDGEATGFGILESTILGEWPTLGLSAEDSFV